MWAIDELGLLRRGLVAQDRRRAQLLTLMKAARPSEIDLTSVRIPELLEFADRNLVAPVAAHGLLSTGVLPGDLETRCISIYRDSASRMEVLLHELDFVSGELFCAGIESIGLKNAGIARGLYPYPGCCPMGDVDVLVRKSRFRDAHAIVLQCGYQLASRSSVEPADLEAGLAGGGTEYFKKVSGVEVWFELQWRPVAGRWILPESEPTCDDFIDRSGPIEGSRLRLLSPEDNMLQVCLHTAKHSYVRAPGLRLHTDVDRLTAFATPEWDAVVSAAKARHVSHSVFFSLALARALLETPIPDSVLEDLAPPKWKRRAMWKWLERADVFYPEESKFNRAEMIAFHGVLYDSLRDLAASTAGVSRSSVSLRGAPRLARGTVSRVGDIVTRYEKS